MNAYELGIIIDCEWGIMKHFKQKEYLFTILLLAVVLFVTGFELKLCQSELSIRKMAAKEIDYEAFRMFRLRNDILEMADTRAEDIIKNNQNMKEMPYVDGIGYLTFSMMATSYDLSDCSLVDENTFCRGIVRLASSDKFQKLYEYNKAVIADLTCFPVPRMKDGKADISYVDSWYQPRTYGGERKHEGTDLMASNNKRGYFPVISMTDGIVEKKGWLEQGGYRIGIRSPSGGYFYYAHLDSYAPELKEGDNVIAGQLLGFMGDSGYGKEGTRGQFDVHLHVGIYVNADSGEMSINPYSILRMLEAKRTYYNN